MHATYQLVAVVQAFGVTVGLGMPLVDGHIPRLGQEMGAHHDRQGAWDGGDRNHGPHLHTRGGDT